MEVNKNMRQRNKVGVIGLGYVGLNLAVLMAENGFQVSGIDIDENKIKAIRLGVSYIDDITNERISGLVSSSLFSASTDYNLIYDLDTIIVCVPTPLNKDDSPDLSYILDTMTEISNRLVEGQLIILESTTFPGTTKDIVLPIFQNKGLTVGKDFYLCYSSERVDPGNKSFHAKQIPKVVSGITPSCRNEISNLYAQVFNKVVVAPSTEVAEFSKLLENSFRFINISFINEMAILSNSLGINIWDAIELASTKPYGFMPFYPGPGIGGHCIPIDPIYLSWILKQHGSDSKFLQLSKLVNDSIKQHVLSNIIQLVGENNLHDKKVIIYGVTYKKDIADIRESPALYLIEELYKLGIQVFYSDPLIPELTITSNHFTSIELTEEALQNSDCVVLFTDHNVLPLRKIIKHAPKIFDTRNITKDMNSSNIFRLGGDINGSTNHNG